MKLIKPQWIRLPTNMHTYRNIPKRYEHVTVNDVPKHISDSFKNIRETRRGMYIHGEVGTGKTHTAFGLLHLAEEMKLRAKIWNTSELFAEIKRDFDRDRWNKNHTAEDLREYKGVLILDDFASEKPTEWLIDQLYLIINARYNEMLPIVFTSNLNVQEVAEKLGDRVTSRIVEMCDIVPMNGEDKRLKHHKKLQA